MFGRIFNKNRGQAWLKFWVLWDAWGKGAYCDVWSDFNGLKATHGCNSDFYDAQGKEACRGVWQRFKR